MIEKLKTTGEKEMIKDLMSEKKKEAKKIVYNIFISKRKDCQSRILYSTIISF